MYWKIEVVSHQLEQVDYIKNLSKFDGAPEDSKEDWSATEIKITDLATKKLAQLQPLIGIAHSTGHPSSPVKPRTIIVRFSSHKDRESIRVRAQQLHWENLSARTSRTRWPKEKQEILPKMQEARKLGYRVFIIYDPVKGSMLIKKTSSQWKWRNLPFPIYR